MKEKKKRNIVVASVIVAIMLIIAIIVAIVVNKNLAKYGSGINESKSVEEEKTIPDDKKAIVTFLEENGEYYEDVREVDREKILRCADKLSYNFSREMLLIDWGLLEQSVALFYLEFEYNGNCYGHYGAVTYGNFVEINHYNSYKTCAAMIESETYDIVNPFALIRENARSASIPKNIVEIRNDTIVGDVRKTAPTGATNIKVGIINKSQNSWIEDTINNNSNENESTEQNNEENAGTKVNVVTENNESYSTEFSQTTVKNNNKLDNKENPRITISSSLINTTNENYTLEYSVANVYEKATITIKQNNKTIANKTMTRDGTMTENIVLLEGTNNIEVTATNSAEKTSTQNGYITYTVSTPKVSIDTSSGSTVRHDNQYNFSYDYSDGYSGKPVDIVIKLNGTIVKEKKGMTSVTSETVYLLEGQNVIEVIVTNYKGKSGSATKTVTFTS